MRPSRESRVSPANQSAIWSPPKAAPRSHVAQQGLPVRTIHLTDLDEYTLGELLMHFMLETIIAAHLLGVDAFDQPAVEQGKVLAKRYLTSAGS